MVITNAGVSVREHTAKTRNHDVESVYSVKFRLCWPHSRIIAVLLRTAHKN